MEAEIAVKIKSEVEKYRNDIIKFLKEIIAIPSYDSQIGDVVQRVNEEMLMLGFDEVFTDKMGNSVGRIGNGPIKVLFDSHIDTVGIADKTQWKWDPFQGKEENGIFYGLGACDEKGSTPPMIYALKIMKNLKLLDKYTCYYFGNMEEECDGIAPHSLVETEKIVPDYVIIGEPTCMRIYRGQRGRIEMKVVTKGRTCHASAPERGENAVYKMAGIISDIEQMGESFKNDPFLGKGSITVSKIECKTPSLNAVPDECTIYIDRRLTIGESQKSAIKEIEALPSMKGAVVEELFFDTPSYTGFKFPVNKYYPPWVLKPGHSLVKASVKAYKAVYSSEPVVDKWVFSTNGTYWMGKANIPAIGFGPGNEIHAHTVLDQVPLEEVVKATEFYAAIPLFL
ncbi:MAG: YgeY family selenium metabolism-linked hydrolase [Candidatus Riflebacteria bacterium]|nr:YgeY family selenium metabolism-linked hydrolase [Candidatus Riflebacteria bacterium]